MKNIVKIAMSVMLAVGCAYIAKSQACGGVGNSFSGNEKTSSALGSQNIVVGENSTTAGLSNEINGECLFVSGADNKVWGKSSVAMGVGNTVLGKGLTEYSAFAIGESNESMAKLAFSFGYKNVVNGIKSMAFGDQNSITKNNSFAFGRRNDVSNANSFAIGNNNTINSTASITIGFKLKNTKECGITIGYGYNTTDKLLVNNTNGIMMGINSDKPTFFISNAGGMGKTGKVGIGNVTEPQAKLHIKADSGENVDILLDGANPSLYFRNKDNCVSVVNNSMNFTSPKYDFKNAGITMYRNASTQISEIFINGTSNKISVGPDNTMSFSAGGFCFTTQKAMTMDVGSATMTSGEAMAFTAGGYTFNKGNVSIGTTRNDGYKLAVKGVIRAEEVVVEMMNDWPDYVFNKDYSLSSLNEVKKYIDDNGHLPGMPSAEEISEDGVKLGEINAKLLEKIEELTIYIIQQEERIQALENKLDSKTKN